MGSWLFVGLFIGCIVKLIFMKPVLDGSPKHPLYLKTETQITTHWW